MPWGRWPLTIHSAGWGIIFNVIVVVVVSAMTQNEQSTAHRMKYHNFLREHASLPASKKGLKPIAWIITLAWFFFGIGPGAVIGNDIFGSPNAGSPEGWTFGIPSIWAWQILFWLARRVHDVVPCVQDGNVHRSGHGSRGACGRHR